MRQPSKARPVKIGVGMLDKRARILRSLDARITYLDMIERLHPWAPPMRQERPARPPDPDPYRMRPASHFYSVRERPELKYPAPGAETISEDTMKEWIAVNPFVRGGLQPATVRALCWIETFAPRKGHA